jgi:single-strand DNA-binding protein
VVRNKLAEICEKYLTKGDKVYCEGRIKTRQWLQDGQKRYTTEIHVANMTFLSTKKETEGSTLTNADKSSMITSQDKNETIEDDLPF